LPRTQTVDELGENLIICEAAEMIDRLAHFAEIGIDDVITSSNFGQPQDETMEMMERFAEQVIPHVSAVGQRAVA
jgi:alkanesulfonate monooxygenase SsuD/methylene tetrahydromethanopterin reductase-like flavin-dependent oxidoreductase (luciferase family)